MSIGKIHNWKKVVAQLMLLVVPTSVFFFYLLWDLNRFYNILQNDWMNQGIYFTAGSVIAITFYAYRFRFTTTAAILFLIYYLIYKLLGSLTVGEFDSFYVSIQFLVFTTLFSLGWIAGFGFSRSKYFTITWSILLLIIRIIVVSKTTDIKAEALISAFVLVLAYSFYIIYTSELIRNMNEDEKYFSWFIIKRMLGFGLVVLILFLAIFNILEKEFKAVEKDWGGSQADYDKGKDNSESMTRKDKNGFIRNKDQTKLSGSLNKDKQLVFVAKLDNYFDDGKTPNPLYFTSCYYTKFDTLTQTFEIDDKMRYNDLFSPDPSKIPLYFAKTDSTTIKNSFATKDRKVISADVYKVALSPNVYLAPSTAFFCQPMSIPKEYKDQYKSAYRAKMWVSDLNSAYFIYNPAGNTQLELFQELRFAKLREIEKINGPDQGFMKYYTFMPGNSDYKKITELAKQVTQDASAPIDKMIAIRNYFLSKNEFGQPLFKYSDNPGIPGMPSASKLNYFLFENKKGYCAYFAGATLFMLRSLGIPSRIAAGYLTVDRSNNNPGWYWFYADQAHAWVQVYFQGYGWIDFDTTIPDVNTQQAEQPDGTPPLNMPQTYLVADGEVQSIDMNKKQITMYVTKLLYHDKDYETKSVKKFLIDASIATITTDTGAIQFNTLKKGMHITAVSYAEALKNIFTNKDDSLASIIHKLPSPTPVDEIKILVKEALQKQQNKEKEAVKKPTNWMNIIQRTLIIIAVLLILLFMTPWLIWTYYNSKAKKLNKNSAYAIYRASLYYLNQLGHFRNELGPSQYASMTDQKFKTSFHRFNNIYQKIKYSTIPASDLEMKEIIEFYNDLKIKVKAKVPFKTRLSKFLNIYNTIHYFTHPKIS